MMSGEDANDDWRLVTLDDTRESPKRHVQLDGLSPNTEYKLTVRAENELGWSDLSQEFRFRTAPG